MCNSPVAHILIKSAAIASPIASFKVDAQGSDTRQSVAQFPREALLSEPAKVSLIVVAAGRGSRLGGEEPKQYRLCAGRPLLCHTLEALSAAYDFCATTIVIHPDDRGRYEQAVASLSAGCAKSLG